MQKALTFLLLLILAVGLLYSYQAIYAGCTIPLTYSLGHLDEQFALSEARAIDTIEKAVAVWEEPAGKDLFVYEPSGGDLTINFFFDERQEFAVAREKEQARLDAVEEENEQVEQTYAQLVEEYDALEARYLARVEAYEAAIDRFNAEVDGYNAAGGAPPEEFRELQERQQELDEERVSISLMAEKLNNLAGKINSLGEEGNRLVERYNEDVRTYNELFGESQEFTQGDYTGDSINIYKFSNERELVAVLAHEFGHALSLPHVEEEESVMYYLMGAQHNPLTLTQSDLDAFTAACEERSSWRQFLPSILTTH